MNAHHNRLLSDLKATVILWLLLSLLLIQAAYAAPCFDDPQRAYDYLLAQEASMIQARTQTIININDASEGELGTLDGIGSSKAQAIILYREMFGRFRTIDDLSKVKGIGVKTVEKNRSRLRVAN